MSRPFVAPLLLLAACSSGTITAPPTPSPPAGERTGSRTAGIGVRWVPIVVGRPALMSFVRVSTGPHAPPYQPPQGNVGTVGMVRDLDQNPAAALDFVQYLGNGALRVSGWAFQTENARRRGPTCSPPGKDTIVRVFIDGLPYPGKYNVPGNTYELGFGRLVAEIYPSLPRPDVRRAFGLSRDDVGFDQTFGLPAEALTLGYHTVHVLVLHRCDDSYNVAAQGSPGIYGIDVPTDFGGLKDLHLSFDPGMDRRLAAMPFPDARFPVPPVFANDPARVIADYAEFCPDSPFGCWNGGAGLPPGAGFYTLANDFPCTVYSTDVPWFNREIEHHLTLPGSHCPFAFNHGWDPANWTPMLEVDTQNLLPGDLSSHYLGLQLNPDAGLYGGLDVSNPEHLPDMSNVVAATVTLRDFVCYPHALRDQPRAARFIYYFDWISDHTYVAAVNLKEFVHRGVGPPNFNTPFYQYCTLDDFSQCPFGRQDNAMHMSADHRYLGNPALSQVARPNPPWNCGDQSSAHEQTYIIPIRDLARRLQAEGHVSPAGMQGVPRYAGGIVAGIETWGQTYHLLSVRDHAFYVNP
jgi:hypothetical protein